MKNRSVPIGAAAFAIIAVLPVLLPAKVLPDFGLWLRNLSLSGGRGNLGAWAIVLALSMLPALGLLWRPGCKWDFLLLLAAAEIFGLKAPPM